jgi:hypothetical protein
MCGEAAVEDSHENILDPHLIIWQGDGDQRGRTREFQKLTTRQVQQLQPALPKRVSRLEIMMNRQSGLSNIWIARFWIHGPSTV